MSLTRRSLVAVLLGTTAAVAGCTSTGLAQGTVALDVRTPAEFAAGHLDGAVNIDVLASTFPSKIASLDKNRTYFVYCHSGNRAGQAITAMKALGFTHLTNGGGITTASQTSGLKIVT